MDVLSDLHSSKLLALFLFCRSKWNISTATVSLLDVLSDRNKCYIIALCFKNFFKLTNNFVKFSIFPSLLQHRWLSLLLKISSVFLICSPFCCMGSKVICQIWALVLFMIKYHLFQKFKLDIGFQFRISYSNINYHQIQKFKLIEMVNLIK